MNSLDPCFGVFLFVALIGTFVYGVVVWNDFSRRRTAIIAAWANVRGLRARRYGVGRAVHQHVYQAVNHEQRVARAATRRGRGARWISDVSNGWPGTAAVGTVSTGLATNVASLDMENQMLQALHAQAQEYNARLMQFPRGFVGRLLGFREWRFTPRHRWRVRGASRRRPH
jgi:hypothetical protein